MLATEFFNNRDGFGYLYRSLKRGDYQIQFKKYSSASDVFDFTVKIYSEKQITILDEEEHAKKNVKLTTEQIKKIPKIGEEA